MAWGGLPAAWLRAAPQRLGAARMPSNELHAAAHKGRLPDLRAQVTAKGAEGTLAAGAPFRAPPTLRALSLTRAGSVWRQR